MPGFAPSEALSTMQWQKIGERPMAATRTGVLHRPRDHQAECSRCECKVLSCPLGWLQPIGLLEGCRRDPFAGVRTQIKIRVPTQVLKCHGVHPTQ